MILAILVFAMAAVPAVASDTVARKSDLTRKPVVRTVMPSGKVQTPKAAKSVVRKVRRIQKPTGSVDLAVEGVGSLEQSFDSGKPHDSNKVPRAEATMQAFNDIKAFVEQEDFEKKSGMSKKSATSVLTCAWMCVSFSDSCDSCLNDAVKDVMGTAIGINGLPVQYATGMLSIPAAGNYVNAWCDGTLEGCAKKESFPGPNTTSHMDWETVWQMGADTPKNEWSGTWWRGNELGFIVNNPYFWSASGIDPFAITLGILPSQHAAIRPVMEKMFGSGAAGLQDTIDTKIKDFLKEKLDTGLVAPTEITEIVHRILYKVAFNQEVDAQYAKDFVALQSKVVALGTISQLFPGFLYSFLEDIRTQITEYVDEYEALIEGLYGEELANEDCSPSTSCARQAASMAFDALYAAGGLSVPTTIATGVGLLFSDDKTNPFPTKSYPAGQELEFYWENLRYFAPVVGFPHWEKRPTCAGRSEAQTKDLNQADGKTKTCPLDNAEPFPTVNQYQGGIRVVPNMAIAQRDVNKWGADGNSFRIRSLDDYKKFSVGFAEMAVDNKVAGGRMNRVCPGKTLALMIGTSFFKQFNKSEWAKPRVPITFGSGPSYVSGFTLSSNKMVADCKEICPSFGLSNLAEKSACELAKKKCKLCKGCKADPPSWNVARVAACKLAAC